MNWNFVKPKRTKSNFQLVNDTIFVCVRVKLRNNNKRQKLYLKKNIRQK